MGAYWSYILAPFGLAGLWMAGRKNAWGWALSTCTQALWLAYAVQTQQWGFIPGTLAYGFVYVRNFRAWRRERGTPVKGFSTAELLRFQREGAKIVTGSPYQEGSEVEYLPQFKGDREPWRVVGLTGADRVRAAGCRPVEPRGGGPWAVARLLTF
jgi:hypothetical protein